MKAKAGLKAKRTRKVRAVRARTRRLRSAAVAHVETVMVPVSALMAAALIIARDSESLRDCHTIGGAWGRGRMDKVARADYAQATKVIGQIMAPVHRYIATLTQRMPQPEAA